ncbi:hypothetical protein PM082_020067 [Marasmius tenuissimus]|nr:hypothetical protein PM082_020067 [Marasmius tenuissimus]
MYDGGTVPQLRILDKMTSPSMALRTINMSGWTEMRIMPPFELMGMVRGSGYASDINPLWLRVLPRRARRVLYTEFHGFWTVYPTETDLSPPRLHPFAIQDLPNPTAAASLEAMHTGVV